MVFTLLHSQAWLKLGSSFADLIVQLMHIASPCEPPKRLICKMLYPFQSEMVRQVCNNSCCS